MNNVIGFRPRTRLQDLDQALIEPRDAGREAIPAVADLLHPHGLPGHREPRKALSAVTMPLGNRRENGVESFCGDVAPAPSLVGAATGTP